MARSEARLRSLVAIDLDLLEFTICEIWSCVDSTDPDTRLSSFLCWD